MRHNKGWAASGDKKSVTDDGIQGKVQELEILF